MTKFVHAAIVLVAVFAFGCAPNSTGGAPGGTGGTSGSGGSVGTGGGTGGTSTGGMTTSTGGMTTSTGGMTTSTGGMTTSTGGMATSTGGAATGGAAGARGGEGGARSGGRGGASTGSSGGAGGGSSICNLSSPVSFKKDVEPLLTNSCGKGVGSGCHVTDASSTMSSGGFDHAYDWVTGGAHASSCPETPTPKRFDVIIAVIGGANPSSCSKSRKMPPPGEGVPPTECQMTALRAWLALPRVTQTHRADDSSPTTPYEMPPYN